MRDVLRVLVAAACLAAAVVSFGADADFWTTPTIHGYGRIHLVPHAAYVPDKTAHYKIVFALTSAATAPGRVNPSLDRVARTVNLYVASGVPLSHLKFVAIAYGGATPLALDDAHYHAQFGVANPNLPLIAELRSAGIDVAVCAQAIAEHHFDYSWLDHTITLALSGLTTVTTLEHAGYVLMPM
jgi:intracellular sulfur oxidation DsrE/DsrF family protein